MDSHLRSRGGKLLCWVVFLGLQGGALTASAATACAGTPEAAIRLDETGAASSPGPAGSGYRVTGVHRDPVLHQRWATVASCDHPEWPAFSLQAGEAFNASSRQMARVSEEIPSAAPLIRAGDIVRLWRQEDMLRIEVTGVAEDNGRSGDTIRVRLLRRRMDDQSIDQEFRGIVRGTSNVEMLR